MQKAIWVLVAIVGIGVLVAVLPTFPRGERNPDKAAESELRNGIAAAGVFYPDNNPYSGFNVAAAQAIEPTLTWISTCDLPVEHTVDICSVADSTVVLQALSETGRSFRIHDIPGAGQHVGRDEEGGSLATVEACDAAEPW